MERKSATEALLQSGFNPQFVAAGMEGFVFDIGNDRLAKVWLTKTRQEVEQLHAFYAQLREKRLPFATPLIQEILDTTTGVTISLEERLAGVALKTLLVRDPINDTLSQKGMDAFLLVTEALERAGEVPAARSLPLLNETSLWTPHSTWGQLLANLVRHRAKRYQTVLQRFVGELQHKVHRVAMLLDALHAPHLTVIHGDICPENVLVDDDTLMPTALLDFGFLTTVADPLFDAVISTLVFDMYSPRSRQMRERLRVRYSQRLGQPFRDIYPLYKAAYALATSNAYSENGEDGHFQWCVDILNDEETKALVS